MTKRVAAGSLEHSLRRALMILGDDGVETAIEAAIGIHRSASLLRKCADPDDGRHHLQLRYALALDLACARDGYAPPLLSAYQRLLAECVAVRPNADADEVQVFRSIIELQATLGKIAEEVRSAFSELSPAEDKLTEGERLAIFDTVEALIGQARQLESLICRAGDTDRARAAPQKAS